MTCRSSAYTRLASCLAARSTRQRVMRAVTRPKEDVRLTRMEHLTFVLGKPMEMEESLTCEFKEVKGQSPVQAIGKAADQYIVAFLNEIGGSIYWGIRNSDRRVVGVRLNQKTRDELHQVLGQKIAAIAPPVYPDLYEVLFHQVIGAEDTARAVEDTFVFEVSVHAPGGGGLYLTGNGEAYRKTLGGTKKLTGAELLIALLTQLQSKMNTSATSEGTDGLDLSWMPSVARRARVVRSLLHGARALWVDGNPGNNLYERTVLASLGVSTDVALSTVDALYMAGRLKYDLILSDMNRGGNPRAGIELLDELTLRKLITPVLYYVGELDRARGTPPGAFGITNRPDQLLHYVLDVLERRGAEAG